MEYTPKDSRTAILPIDSYAAIRTTEEPTAVGRIEDVRIILEENSCPAVPLGFLSKESGELVRTAIGAHSCPMLSCDELEGVSGVDWETFEITGSVLPQFNVIPLTPITTEAMIIKAGKVEAYFEERHTIIRGGAVHWTVVLAHNDSYLGCVFFSLSDRRSCANNFFKILMMAVDATWKKLQGKAPTRVQVLSIFRQSFQEVAIGFFDVHLLAGTRRDEKDRELYVEFQHDLKAQQDADDDAQRVS